MIFDRLDQFRLPVALFQDDEGFDGLAGRLMRLADDRSLRDGRMAHQCTFHLSRADPIAGHFDHVIRAAHEPKVAVRIFMADVAGGIAIGMVFQ